MSGSLPPVGHEPAHPAAGHAQGPSVPEATAASTGVAGWPAPRATELRAMYRDYRLSQGRRLVEMLPRERVRPLYRAAVEAAGPSGRGDDPLEVLVAYCADLLPLPPFRVWAEDVERAPDAYVRDMAESVYAPTSSSPLTVAERAFPVNDASWTATLRGYRADDAWRGFIVFQRGAGGEAHRTAVVFREAEIEDLRDRFLGFEDATLEAFRRSSAT